MTDSRSRCVVEISTDTRPIVYPTIDWLSTDCRLTIDRYIDRVSTDYRPLYWPIYRPIDPSTLPTVNKISIQPAGRVLPFDKHHLSADLFIEEECRRTIFYQQGHPCPKLYRKKLSNQKPTANQYISNGHGWPQTCRYKSSELWVLFGEFREKSVVGFRSY